MNTNTALPAISEHAYLRLFVVFILYIAQGVPYGLIFFAIPAWLAANGASAESVGIYLGMAGLPWTLKFLYGFVMDRYAYLPMGRRRAWLIGAQFFMVAGLIAIAVLNPELNQITLLAALAFTVQLATTLQDVAVDGTAVDLLKDSERSLANGLMFGGQSVGIAAGGAVGGGLIAAYGLSIATLCVAGFVMLVLLMLLVLRERPGEKLLPWSKGMTSGINLERQQDAWLPLLQQAFSVILRPRSVILMVAVVLINASWGFFLGLAPLISAEFAGWEEEIYTATSGAANLVSGILAIVFFGLLVRSLGTRWGMLLATSLFAAVCVYMAMNPQAWSEAATMRNFIYAAICLYVLILVVWAVAAMRMCSPAVAATQFALYMGVANLGIAFGSFLIGPIQGYGGYSAVFFATATGLVIGGLIFLFFAKAGGEMVQLNPRVD